MGSLNDIENSVKCHRQSLELLSADYPQKAMFLCDFGHSILRKFEISGSIHDLNQAVLMTEDVVVSTPSDYSDLALYYNNLGNALNLRFQHTDSLNDIPRSVEVHRASLNLMRPDDPKQPNFLHS